MIILIIKKEIMENWTNITKIYYFKRKEIRYFLTKWYYKRKGYEVEIYEEYENCREYHLTIKDRIYFILHKDSNDRYFYLKKRIRKHHLEWFKKNKIELPKDFDKYIYTCTINVLERL